MAEGPELRQAIKEMMIEELMLDFEVSEIENETPIFGAGGLGLDSVDALQLVVAIEMDVIEMGRIQRVDNWTIRRAVNCP